jgi:hypothetical protein
MTLPRGVRANDDSGDVRMRGGDSGNSSESRRANMANQLARLCGTVRGCYSRWVTEISDHGACQSRIDGDSLLHVSNLPEKLNKGFRCK